MYVITRIGFMLLLLNLSDDHILHKESLRDEQHNNRHDHNDQCAHHQSLWRKEERLAALDAKGYGLKVGCNAQIQAGKTGFIPDIKEVQQSDRGYYRHRLWKDD